MSFSSVLFGDWITGSFWTYKSLGSQRLSPFPSTSDHNNFRLCVSPSYSDSLHPTNYGPLNQRQQSVTRLCVGNETFHANTPLSNERGRTAVELGLDGESEVVRRALLARLLLFSLSEPPSMRYQSRRVHTCWIWVLSIISWW